MDLSDRALARWTLAALAGICTAIGVGYLVATGPLSRAAGLTGEPSTRWALRMFGVREVLLGLGLYDAWRRDDPERARAVAGLTAAAQVGDIAVALAMARRLPRRLTAGVVLGAVPTLAALALVVRGYRGR